MILKHLWKLHGKADKTAGFVIELTHAENLDYILIFRLIFIYKLQRRLLESDSVDIKTTIDRAYKNRYQSRIHEKVYPCRKFSYIYTGWDWHSDKNEQGRQLQFDVNDIPSLASFHVHVKVATKQDAWKNSLWKIRCCRKLPVISYKTIMF